jgi:hypothetical protein
MLDRLMDSVVDYCSRESTRERLETRVLGPLLQYLGERFAWSFKLFQAMALLVLLQTLILLWLLVREVRRPAPLLLAAA